MQTDKGSGHRSVPPYKVAPQTTIQAKGNGNYTPEQLKRVNAMNRRMAATRGK